MSVKIKIKQVPSPNYYSRAGNRVAGIVYHIAEGFNLDGVLTDPNNYDAQGNRNPVSAHFGIFPDGDIHQYVQLDQASWHCGRVLQPDSSLPMDLYKPGITPNWTTIGIENAGFTGNPWPEQQIQANIDLSLYLMDQGICSYLAANINPNRLIGHYRLDSISRARCPGIGFPWARLFAELDGSTLNTHQRDTIGWAAAVNQVNAEQRAVEIHEQLVKINELIQAGAENMDPADPRLIALTQAIKRLDSSDDELTTLATEINGEAGKLRGLLV